MASRCATSSNDTAEAGGQTKMPSLGASDSAKPSASRMKCTAASLESRECFILQWGTMTKHVDVGAKNCRKPISTARSESAIKLPGLCAASDDTRTKCVQPL